jgi:hypothetical protein
MAVVDSTHLPLPPTAGPHTSRQLRTRKRVRSESPYVSDLPTDDYDSDYATDEYGPESDVGEDARSPGAAYSVPAHGVREEMKMDDSSSPRTPLQRHARSTNTVLPFVDDNGGVDSGASSSDPPMPTELLPVRTSELLPSRPSTAAVPPGHIKDRLVKSAKKLLTAADGVNESVQVQVIPIYYPSKNAPKSYKIRLIRVYNTDTETVSMYAHAADVGGVVVRKSNISRLFGKFESPAEKLLMNVVGAHNSKEKEEKEEEKANAHSF